MKRTDYISWDEYFMGIAMFSAQRSKDSNTQVGACIVNRENKIVSVGYNGMPTGCLDDDMPWEREGPTSLDTKYPFVCHAELNAILNSNIGNLGGCTLYVTLFPCNECAKAIIQSGIKRVVFYDNKYADTESVKASCLLFERCGVKFDMYEPSGKNITLSL
ncbi:MAG: dCMP deaminase family protein [Ruminococcus sp.]|nr:dCMP deaminase family protein [Ruminococcus sp.]